MLERLTACYIIAKKDNVSTPVEDPGNGLERLLASCIPNLHLNDFLITFNYKRPKLNSYCHLVVNFERVILDPCE